MFNDNICDACYLYKNKAFKCIFCDGSYIRKNKANHYKTFKHLKYKNIELAYNCLEKYICKDVILYEILPYLR